MPLTADQAKAAASQAIADGVQTITAQMANTLTTFNSQADTPIR